MSIALLLAITPLLGFVADVQGTLGLADFSQVLARPAAIGSGQAIDLATTPAVSVGLAGQRASFGVGYAPRFALTDILRDQPGSQVFHTVTAQAGWAYITPRFTLRLSESGSVARLNLLTLALAPAPSQPLVTAPADPTVPRDQPAKPLTPDPAMARINLLTSTILTTATEQTTATAAYRWSPRWQSTVSAGYGIAGGLGARAQESLPQARTATVGASAAHTLSRRDSLNSTLSASQVTLSNGFNHWILILGEAWNRQVTEDWSTLFLVGVATTSSHEDAGHRKGSVLPTGSGSLRGTLARERNFVLSLGVGTSVAPVVNPLNGTLQTRWQGTGALQMASHETTASASVDAAQTFPLNDPNEARIVGAGLGVGQGIGELVNVSAAFRTFWQQAKQQVVSLPLQWIATVGISVRAPPIKF